MKRFFAVLWMLVAAAAAQAQTTTTPPTPAPVITQRVNISLVWLDQSTNEKGFNIYQCLGAGCTRQ